MNLDFSQSLDEGILKAELDELKTKSADMNNKLDQLAEEEEKAQDELNDEAEKQNKNDEKV